jgi:hypothetical protein
MKPIFWLGCYGYIFHRTGNSAQLWQNFRISGGGGDGGVWTPPSTGTPLPSDSFLLELQSEGILKRWSLKHSLLLVVIFVRSTHYYNAGITLTEQRNNHVVLGQNELLQWMAPAAASRTGLQNIHENDRKFIILLNSVKRVKICVLNIYCMFYTHGTSMGYINLFALN